MFECQSCITGYYLQPYTKHCDAGCPTAFAPVSGLCKTNSVQLLSYNFNKDSQFYTSSPYAIKAERKKPIYRNNQGLYFFQGDYVEFPDSPILPAQQVTLEAWILPKNTQTTRVIFENQGLVLQLTADNKVQLAVKQDDMKILSTTASVADS
mmetsp:Transcript_13175/g.24659  ORF Transcript_13175/g.24659 Transcript_13175/m.24659 type:complete len:152 (-) Transcript_13175:2427-2882(-)